MKDFEYWVSYKYIKGGCYIGDDFFVRENNMLKIIINDLKNQMDGVIITNIVKL